MNFHNTTHQIWLLQVLSTGMESVPESLIQEAFDVFDVDGDGKISLSELRVMLSGEGPLVEVLPNGQTVDEVMEEIAGGKQSISFPDFVQYISKASVKRRKSRDRSLKGQGTAGEQVVATMVEELEESEASSQAPEVPLEDGTHTEYVVEASAASHLPAPNYEDDPEEALWRAFGPQSKERWTQNRPNSRGGSFTMLPREAFHGSFPAMHEFLLKAFGGTLDHDDPMMQDRRKALDCILRFPEQPITMEKSDMLAAHVSSLSQHFMAGMVLVRLLADAEDTTKGGTLHKKLQQAIQAMKIDAPSPRHDGEPSEPSRAGFGMPSAAPSPAPPSDWASCSSPKATPSAPSPSPVPVRQLRSRPPQAKRPWGARAPVGDESREVRLAELRKKTRPKGLKSRARQRHLIPATAEEVTRVDSRQKYPWHVEVEEDIFMPELVMGPAKRAAYDPPPVGVFQGPMVPKLPRLGSYKGKPRRAGPVLKLRPSPRSPGRVV